jgi:hypothetical protein
MQRQWFWLRCVMHVGCSELSRALVTVGSTATIDTDAHNGDNHTCRSRLQTTASLWRHQNCNKEKTGIALLYSRHDVALRCKTFYRKMPHTALFKCWMWIASGLMWTGLFQNADTFSSKISHPFPMMRQKHQDVSVIEGFEIFCQRETFWQVV